MGGTAFRGDKVQVQVQVPVSVKNKLDSIQDAINNGRTRTEGRLIASEQVQFGAPPSSSSSPGPGRQGRHQQREPGPGPGHQGRHQQRQNQGRLIASEQVQFGALEEDEW